MAGTTELVNGSDKQSRILFFLVNVMAGSACDPSVGGHQHVLRQISDVDLDSFSHVVCFHCLAGRSVLVACFAGL
jgi:hypothetical protein